jgi:porin
MRPFLRRSLERWLGTACCWLGLTMPPPLLAQEWSALPTWMDLELQVVAEPMLNPAGGLSTMGSWMQQSSASLSVGRGVNKDSANWSEADHWQLNLQVNHYAGNPLYGQEIGAIFPLQQVAHGDGFWMSELSLQRQAGTGWLGFKAGVLALNPDFIAAPVFNYYVHSALNDTLNITINDLPINPYAAAGGLVTIEAREDVSLRYGLFNLSSTLPVADWLGLKQEPPSAGKGWVQLLQLTYTPAWLTAGSQKPTAAAKPPNPLPEGLLQAGGYSTRGDGYGIYGTVTWSLPLAIGRDHRLWVGSNLSVDDPTDLSPLFVGAGLISQGVLPGRPEDVLILGVGRSSLTPNASSGLTSTEEGLVELGYQLQVNPWLTLKPSLQWIVNPGPRGDVPGIFATGLEIGLQF